MRRTAPLLVSIGLSAGLAAALIARPAGAAPDAAPQRIAFVDMLEIMNGAPRKTQIEADNLKRRDAIEDWVKAERRRINQDSDAIILMPRGEARTRKERDVELAKAKYDLELKWKASDAGRAYGESLDSFYSEVKTAIRGVAASLGYSIVLNKIDEPLGDIQSTADFINQVAARTVLIYDPNTDITKAVKEKLSAPRAPGNAPPVAPPPPGPVAPPPGPSAVPPPPSGLPPPNPVPAPPPAMSPR